MPIWEKVQAWIQNRMNQQSFEAWFKPVSMETLSGDSLILEVPNKFFKEWLSNHYIEIIKEAVLVETGKHVKVEFVVKEDGELNLGKLPTTTVERPTEPELFRSFRTREIRLNPKYAFENFVVGRSNQFPYGAAQAVVEVMGTKYNPLFVYGTVGLGKTHLLHAIGNAIQKKRPGIHICYISSEQFMNEFVSCIKNDKMDLFHSYFRRENDVLLMDDIQFIAGKSRTQDEFFHTFNQLYEDSKQIILASDKYPQEIPDLEERLCSRFQWGLITDIQPPEFETRVAIVNQKANEEGIELPADVVTYLASSIKSNVRELEGSLINLAAHASLNGQQIDLAFAKEMLEKVIFLHQSAITVEGIQATICKHFSISLEDLKSAKRQRSVVFPRQVAMFLCRKALNTSFPELGQRFGGKDHTTAIAACKKIERLISENVDIRGRIEGLGRLIGL